MTEPSPRIAIYLRALLNTGIEPVMLNLASQFIQQEISVDFVLNHADERSLSRLPTGVRLIDLKTPGLPAGLPRLVRYLRQERPRALLSAQHLTNEFALLAKRLAGVPTRFIVSEHNTLSIEWRDKPKLKERLTPWFARSVYPWADGIVAVSRGVGEDLARTVHLAEERVQVIYNPIVTPELSRKAAEPVSHPWFQPGEPPVILGAGRLTEQKDFPTLIRAFAEVRREHEARLVILGTGPEQRSLKGLVRESGLEEQVVLLGQVDNALTYMSKAAVFALSSAWEGLPTVLIEAMAVGSPIVSTDCKSGPAEILDNGRYGELVPVGDSHALARAILGVLSGGAKPVSPEWLEQFSVARVTRQYVNLLLGEG
jgi:glycosyltransferase involved in cell wall biosynthesis